MDPSRPPGDAARWARIQALFEAAVELPGDARAAWLADACGDDADLQAAVQRLLAADAGSGGLLDSGITLAARELLSGGEAGPEPAVLPAGARIGAWRILGELGHGGMGIVYLAERADGGFEQQAALKVVRGGRVSGLLEKRFLQERQILARLDHPNIARLLDGGFTPEGAPWLAMERVEGLPIHAWAEQQSLDLRGRIGLLLQVCDAVSYAHSRLVVHRDLKPSNLLVTADGHVRLLDFGIARLLGPDEDAGEALTRAGMLALTPEYAAPEQLRGEAAGTATDVYSLGAVLYELLSGQRPFELDSRGLTDMLRILEEDPVPLGRLPGLAPALRKRLAGDLETIVAKAMEKAVERRYPSVEALAEDLRRHLAGEPVSARPGTLAYRAGRYVRRHRIGVAAAALVFLSLAAGMAGTLWQARTAQREASRAQAVAGFLFDLFSGVDPGRARGREISARELVEEGVARIGALPEGSELRVETLALLGQLYMQLGLYDRAEELLRRAVAEAGQHLPDKSPLSVRAIAALGSMLMDAGRYPEAEALIQRSLEARRRGIDGDNLGDSLLLLAQLRRHQGQAGPAEQLYREALSWERRRHGPRSVEAAGVLANLALLLEENERYPEAEQATQEVLAIRRASLGDDHPDVGITIGMLAAIRGSLGDLREAERLHREELALMRRIYKADHPSIAAALDQVAIYVDRQGRYDEAEALLNEALELRRRLLGESHPDVGSTLNNLATLYYRTGDMQRAADSQRRALQSWQATLGEEHWKVATATNNLGVMLRELGRLDEAERLLVRGHDMRRRLLGESHSDVGASLNNLGGLKRLRGNLAGAERDYRAALANFRDNFPEGHWRIADAAHGLGITLAALGRRDEARALLEEALAIRRSQFVAEDPRIAETEAALAAAR